MPGFAQRRSSSATQSSAFQAPGGAITWRTVPMGRTREIALLQVIVSTSGWAKPWVCFCNLLFAVGRDSNLLLCGLITWGKQSLVCGFVLDIT